LYRSILIRVLELPIVSCAVAAFFFLTIFKFSSLHEGYLLIILRMTCTLISTSRFIWLSPMQKHFLSDVLKIQIIMSNTTKFNQSCRSKLKKLVCPHFHFHFIIFNSILIHIFISCKCWAYCFPRAYLKVVTSGV